MRSRFKRLWNICFPSIPLPIRLPYGGWWLAANDVCGDAVFTGRFEENEWRFLNRFLKKGMVVLDIGAHHGFYTILAAKKVGSSGRVVAFEPSPRELRRLAFHLKVNHIVNVEVEPFALASEDGQRMLFLVDGRDTGCNSLRPPAVSEPTREINVKTKSLDDYLGQHQNIGNIDLVKMDVEGAELEVLKGAARLLRRNPRPVFMVEVQDIRSAPWGYAAGAVYDTLAQSGFHWFSIGTNGVLTARPRTEQFDANLVAVPEELLAAVDELCFGLKS